MPRMTRKKLDKNYEKVSGIIKKRNKRNYREFVLKNRDAVMEIRRRVARLREAYPELVDLELSPFVAHMVNVVKSDEVKVEEAAKVA